jgi:hypothetical protein
VTLDSYRLGPARRQVLDWYDIGSRIAAHPIRLVEFIVELAIVKELDKVALALAVQLALDGKAIEQGTSTQLIRCIGSGRQVDVHSSVQVAKNATLEGIARGQLSNDLLQRIDKDEYVVRSISWERKRAGTMV